MRWIGLLVLCLIGILGALSYQLFSILLQPIQGELDFSDTTIGLINGLALATIGALAGFPIGWAADRYGRRMILGGSVLVWSAFVFVMGLAESQLVFVAGVVGVNLGDAALIPLLYGIVATAFAGRNRDIANAAMVLALAVGGSAVFSVGGHLLRYFADAPIYDLAPWRAVCVSVALFGFLIVPLLLTVPAAPGPLEPREAQVSSGASNYASFGHFFRSHGITISTTYLGITFYYIAFFVFLFWVPALLERRFGVTTADASIAVGTPLIVSSIAAIVLANLGLWYFKSGWQELAPLRMVMAGCVLALPSAILAGLSTTADTFILAVAGINLGVIVSMSLAPALLQNCAPDAYRSRTIALFPVLALGVRVVLPAFVPWLSDELGGAPQTLLNVNVAMVISCLIASLIILWFSQHRYAALAREVMEG